jgi:hypothetical protein
VKLKSVNIFITFQISLLFLCVGDGYKNSAQFKPLFNFHDPTDGGCMLLQNVVAYLPVYMVLEPRQHNTNLADPPTELHSVMTQMTTV